MLLSYLVLTLLDWPRLLTGSVGYRCCCCVLQALGSSIDDMGDPDNFADNDNDNNDDDNDDDNNDDGACREEKGRTSSLEMFHVSSGILAACPPLSPGLAADDCTADFLPPALGNKLVVQAACVSVTPSLHSTPLHSRVLYRCNQPNRHSDEFPDSPGSEYPASSLGGRSVSSKTAFRRRSSGAEHADHSHE